MEKNTTLELVNFAEKNGAYIAYGDAEETGRLRLTMDYELAHLTGRGPVTLMVKGKSKAACRESMVAQLKEKGWSLHKDDIYVGA